MSAYLDRPRRSMEEIADELDAEIAGLRKRLRQAQARNAAIIEDCERRLAVLEDRRDSIADAMQARDEARWRAEQ